MTAHVRCFEYAPFGCPPPRGTGGRGACEVVSLNNNVIHVNAAPEGWENDPRFVYIGRPCPRRRLAGSPFSNPFTVEGNGRWRAIEMFEEYARERMEAEPHFRERLQELLGKVLVCWCDPWPCHGEVLTRLARELAIGSAI